MPTATDDKVTLAEFPRRNRSTGAEEAIRVESADFNGKQYLHVRLWYMTRPNGTDDDGWRPSKTGVALREHELDALAEAVEQARQLVHEQGRSTSEDSPSPRTRGDRPSSPAPSRRPATAAGGSSRPPARPAVAAGDIDDDDELF